MRTSKRRGQWVRRLALFTGVGVVGVVMAACGSSPSRSTAASSSTSSTSASSTSSTGTKVDSATSAEYGTILVDASGKTLYMLTADSSTSSVCKSSCVTLWPPLTTTAGAKAGSGVKGALLGTITRSDGSKQVTYNGHPLYTFSGDSSAGQTNGEKIASFGGIWYVLDTSGKPVTAASSSTTSSSSSGSGGYGY
jgi:predicted lipoprotein with Yx(FWY)xxD motif